ncbi:MAG: uroporphyrinogen decarboxylase family protein [Spirochaetota bacterium]
MTARERSKRFIANDTVDRPPFHPIVMRIAAKHAGIPYGKFCTDAKSKAVGYVRYADDFGMDWVTVMSDPYTEATAFGLPVEFPEDDLPKDTAHIIESIADIARLKKPSVENSARPMAAVDTIREYKKMSREEFIVGWVEGPMAEYADLRGLSSACTDLMDDPKAVCDAADIINAFAKEFASAQIAAGADCIGIGDAACSQIGPDLYRELFFPREKELVDHIHAQGALAKLHICGNTTALLPDMIRTGADIIDVDHLVKDMSAFAPLLGKKQVFSGNSDPVAVIERGDERAIRESVASCFQASRGRTITSAGCEIPPDARDVSMKIYRDAAYSLR